MRINLGFWFLFFGLLGCQFSCLNDAENRLDDLEARERFVVLLEEKPFGPYAFTDQSKVSVFASLLDLLNQVWNPVQHLVEVDSIKSRPDFLLDRTNHIAFHDLCVG